jgi:hypothetical protein
MNIVLFTGYIVFPQDPLLTEAPVHCLCLALDGFIGHTPSLRKDENSKFKYNFY